MKPTTQRCKHCEADLGPYPGFGRPRSRCDECKRKDTCRYTREHRQRTGRGPTGVIPRPPRTGKTKYCSRYVPGHPNAGKNGNIAEHRLIMSGMLGRALAPNETVHHKNGQRHDNRPENLELRVGAHGQGSTPEEALAWAREIVERYTV